MLKSAFRRIIIENSCRLLPVSSKTCRTIGSTIVEADDLELEGESPIERYREPKKHVKNFIENLYLGVYDPLVLEYPQIRTKEETDYLINHGERINHLMLHGIDYKDIEMTGKISQETLERLKEFDLLGMKIKFKNEGLGYFESESYYVQESLYLSSSVGKVLAENENSGYKIVQLFGNDEQKNEYIPKYLNGGCVSCLAHLETGSWISQESSSISTTAVQNSDGSFVISGRKTLVYNPNFSDFLVVSAVINGNPDNSSYTLFIVDRNSKGVSVLEPFDKFSLKGTEICDVVLDNVVVSQDKIIGKINGGNDIVNELLSQGKLSNGGYCLGLMRKLVNEAINHCIVKNHFKKPLHEYKYIQGKIGEITQALYEAESMTYLMTGRLDEDPDLDAKLESLIVKIFNSEALNFILYNYMHLVGRDNCNDELIERIIRDSPFFTACDEPNTYLKMVLATTGVKYTLNQMSNRTVTSYKPKNRFKLNILKRAKEFPDDEMLQQYLHLTLKEESSILEFCINSLNLLTELLIHEHGRGGLTKPYFLSHLAELTIIIYKLTAVLGRASRSYCIGLRNSEREIRIARNASQGSYQKALTALQRMGENLKSGPTYENVASYVSACGNFSSHHPAEPLQKRKSST